MIKIVKKKNRRKKGKHFKSWLKELRKIYKITHMCSRWKNPFEKSNYKFIQKIPIYVEWVNTKKIERKIRDRRTDGELDQILGGKLLIREFFRRFRIFQFCLHFCQSQFPNNSSSTSLDTYGYFAFKIMIKRSICPNKNLFNLCLLMVKIKIANFKPYKPVSAFFDERMDGRNNERMEKVSQRDGRLSS